MTVEPGIKVALAVFRINEQFDAAGAARLSFDESLALER
jgi:hypothetical protein